MAKRPRDAAQTVVRKLPVCGQLNVGKAALLTEIGAELDKVRAMVWRRFTGAKTSHLSPWQVRDTLMKEGSPADFAVPQRLWRATVEDTVDKIRAWQRAVIVDEVRPRIYARTDDEDEQKRLLTLAKIGRWRDDPWLSRRCRKALVGKNPRSKPSGRVVFDNWSYDAERDERGQLWLAVMTTQKRRRMRINLGKLPDYLTPESTIEIRPDDHHGWVVIAAYPAGLVSSTRPKKPDPSTIEGVDAGVRDVLTTTDGRKFGENQYKKIAAKAERDCRRIKARHKLRNVRNRHLKNAETARQRGDFAAAKRSQTKARRIEKHNLGTKKLSRQRERDRAEMKSVIFQAVHDLVDSTDHVVAEDLSGMRGKAKFRGKPAGPAVNRVFASWMRSFLADALASVPSRRGSAVTFVNPAYTSQQLQACGHLGARDGRNVHCETAGCPQHGIVHDAETNAASVILARATDPDIHLYTPVAEVRRILLERVGTAENCPATTQAA